MSFSSLITPPNLLWKTLPWLFIWTILLSLWISTSWWSSFWLRLSLLIANQTLMFLKTLQRLTRNGTCTALPAGAQLNSSNVSTLTRKPRRLWAGKLKAVRMVNTWKRSTKIVVLRVASTLHTTLSVERNLFTEISIKAMVMSTTNAQIPKWFWELRYFQRFTTFISPSYMVRLLF